ncbi:MAG: type II secretion system F family protein [Bdellovibrionota bacterium]
MSFLGNDFVFIVLMGICIFAASFFFSDKILNFLYEKSLGSRQYVLDKLELMFVETNPKKITMTMLSLSFGLGFLVFIAVFPNLITGFILGGFVTIAGWQAPKYLVDYLFEKRCNKLVDQMVDGLTIMSNGIRAGLGITQSMERVVDNMPSPIKQEFGLVLSQIKLGLSVEEALSNFGNRIPVADVQMFVTAINILKETGGNLAETFTTMVEVLRERQKIHKKIEALTAQGVTQGIIITMVPFILLIVFTVVDPGFVKPLFTTTMGVIFLILMLTLQAIGGFMIRKIVKIKV